MEAAKKVFADLEKCGDGKLSSTALMAMVREKVPEAEVEYAIEDALVEAGYASTKLSCCRQYKAVVSQTPLCLQLWSVADMFKVVGREEVGTLLFG